nr:hypothetical protein [Thalassospira sp. HF15]
MSVKLCNRVGFAQAKAFAINWLDADGIGLLVNRCAVFAFAAAIFRHGLYRTWHSASGSGFKTSKTVYPASALALLPPQFQDRVPIGKNAGVRSQARSTDRTRRLDAVA